MKFWQSLIVWNPMTLLPSSPSSSSLRHGQIAKPVAIGPGNVPEQHRGRIRDALADDPRGEREMIVLDQDDGRCAVGFLADGVGEETLTRQ